MDGAIVEILVEPGEFVEQGQVVVILEAMKMAHQLKASAAGSVAEITVSQGQQVKARQIVVQICEAVE
jgi:geranyl-CoA carboxylase alpha subunit